MNNSNNKKVSIIIPCYNQGEYLEECLKSVFSSSYKNIEVIVVNDGSTDDTKYLMDELEQKFTFKAIHQENSGPSKARNTAIKESSGEYILPLDADDIISRDYIESAVEVLENQKNVGIVYCNAELFGEKSGKWNLPPFSLDKMLTENLIFNCALFRRVDFDNTIGYNPNMKEGWEDWDFWLSILELKKEVVKLELVGFYYRIRSNSREHASIDGRMERLRKQIYQNHLQFYIDSFSNPIEQHFKIKELEEFQKSFHQLKNSFDYQLGRKLLLPLRSIKKFFNKG